MFLTDVSEYGAAYCMIINIQAYIDVFDRGLRASCHASVRSKKGGKDNLFYLIEKTIHIRASGTIETEGSSKWHSRCRRKCSDEKE